MPTNKVTAPDGAPPTQAELTDEDVQLQAHALAGYVQRGGSASRWLDSKGFAQADRSAILIAYADVEDQAS
jgi:hypothetical protein